MCQTQRQSTARLLGVVAAKGTTVSEYEEDILKELRAISCLLGDLSAIRKGQYEPPRGADPRAWRTNPLATTEDIWQSLRTVMLLLEQQCELLRNIGRAVAGNDRQWERLQRS